MKVSTYKQRINLHNLNISNVIPSSLKVELCRHFMCKVLTLEVPHYSCRHFQPLESSTLHQYLTKVLYNPIQINQPRGKHLFPTGLALISNPPKSNSVVGIPNTKSRQTEEMKQVRTVNSTADQ